MMTKFIHNYGTPLFLAVYCHFFTTARPSNKYYLLNKHYKSGKFLMINLEQKYLMEKEGTFLINVARKDK